MYNYAGLNTAIAIKIGIFALRFSNLKTESKVVT